MLLIICIVSVVHKDNYIRTLDYIVSVAKILQYHYNKDHFFHH